MTEPVQPEAAGWRCTSTNPEHPERQCWYPAGHKGRDAANNWDLHQDENGDQW